MTRHVTTSIEGGILTLTLARPDKKNALTNGMYAVLADALEAAEADPAIRVVSFQAEGDCFTAGNDIGEFTAMAAAGDSSEGQHVFRFLRALAGTGLPLVAAVQGRAVGIGTTMLLHCDLVLLAEDARLSTPFIDLALVPEAASSLLLPARIGHVRAFAMFALGQVVDAGSAVAWGLANAVVPAAGLRASAREAAERISRQPPRAVAVTKRLMRDAAALATRIEAENSHFIERLQSPEAKAAITAFATRRRPDVPQ